MGSFETFRKNHGGLKLPHKPWWEKEWGLCEGWGSCHKGRAKAVTPERRLRGEMPPSQEGWSQRPED